MRFLTGSDETRIKLQSHRTVIASISVTERQRENVGCDGCRTLTVRAAGRECKLEQFRRCTEHD